MNILEQIKSGQDFTVTWNHNMNDVMRNASFDCNLIDGTHELFATVATATQQIQLIREYGFTIFFEDGKSQGMGFAPIDGFEWQAYDGDENMTQALVSHIIATQPALLDPNYGNLTDDELTTLDNEISIFAEHME